MIEIKKDVDQDGVPQATLTQMAASRISTSPTGFVDKMRLVSLTSSTWPPSDAEMLVVTKVAKSRRYSSNLFEPDLLAEESRNGKGA